MRSRSNPALLLYSIFVVPMALPSFIIWQRLLSPHDRYCPPISIAMNLLHLHPSLRIVPLLHEIMRALLLDLRVVHPLCKGLADPGEVSCSSRSCTTRRHQESCAFNRIRYSCRTLSASFPWRRPHFSSCRGRAHDQAPMLQHQGLMEPRDLL